MLGFFDQMFMAPANEKSQRTTAGLSGLQRIGLVYLFVIFPL